MRPHLNAANDVWGRDGMGLREGPPQWRVVRGHGELVGFGCLCVVLFHKGGLLYISFGALFIRLLPPDEDVIGHHNTVFASG